MNGPPERLLLATDLSARGDRALDRAAQLAGQWQAELVVLNVLASPDEPDLALSWAEGQDSASRHRFALQELQRDLAGLDVRATVRLGRGDAARAIRETADDCGCGLIVTGMARSEPLGRFLLGSTVERLARMVPQPLLVVRMRARHPYARIVVATDFSESSRHALQAAARFFQGQELTVYHAHDPGLAGIAQRQAEPGSAPAGHDECAGFIAACDLPPDTRAHLRTVVEYGPLGSTLSRYVREQGVELVVTGTHGRTGLMNVLLGSSAARLLDWLPCDTMIVREPRASR